MYAGAMCAFRDELLDVPLRLSHETLDHESDSFGVIDGLPGASVCLRMWL